MMKKKLFLLILIITAAPFLVKAQQSFSLTDKTIIASRIDTLLQSFMQKSGLKLPGENKRNDKVVGDLRKMIAVDAEVFDDINAVYNEKTKQYELKSKSRNSHIDDLIENFPKGLTINNKNLNINYANFDKNEVVVALQRDIRGTNSSKFSFFNDDTLLIKIRINSDKTVKISEISSIGSHLECTNDDDMDGVIDELDECRKDPGLVALNGCPDDDKDGIPNFKDKCPNEAGPESNGGCQPSTFAYQFVLGGSVGFQFSENNMGSEMPVNALSGYQGVDDQNSQLVDKIKNSGTSTNLVINAHIAYFFGKSSNKTTGISLGVSFSNFKSTYNFGGLKYFFKAEDGVQQNYHQIVTFSTDAKEEISFNTLNIPLMLRYKKKFGFIAFEIAAGPSLLYMKPKTSTIQGTYDLEAIYEYKPSSDADQKPIPDYHEIYMDTVSYQWKITQEYISGNTGGEHFPNPASEMDYLATDRGGNYNVGLAQGFNTAGSISQRISIAANASADLFYHVSPTAAVKAGVSLTYSKLSHKNDHYTTVTKRTDDGEEYNSLYNSSIKSTYFAYGFNLGIIIGLNLNKK